MKHIFSKCISPEQYGFLQNIKIHDDVAIAQESLHSIHVNKVNAPIMKIDLKKAYDCLNWGYHRMVLHKIEIQISGTEWIMACVKNVRYAVVVNGYPSHYFGASRGLRQGCSLSPLLFILSIDGISLHIKKLSRKDILKLCT